MSPLELTVDERDVLCEAIECRLNDLRREIAEADCSEFRVLLGRKRRILEKFLRRLEADDTKGRLRNTPGKSLPPLPEVRVITGVRRSRRLGRSLAVDVIPAKACPLDCIYCERGRTDLWTAERKQFVGPDQVEAELRRFLTACAGPVDAITLSACGEPTLNSSLGEIIRRIKGMTRIPVAVLTGSALIYDAGVREDLMAADIVIPSLDAVSEEVFTRVNRPCPGVTAAAVVEGLFRFREQYRGAIWLEIMLVRGFNDGPEELDRICETAKQLRPDRIHLNTIARKPARKFAASPDPDLLRDLRSRLGPACSVV